MQAEYGFQPDYDYQDVFDPSDLTNYQGPPLPSKYASLMYLKDWHLPGKEKRRKRRHRKTHGKISFHQLSLMIAENWRSVDDETRQFCSDLCDVGLIQYKNQMRAWKAAHPNEVDEEISVKTSAKKSKKLKQKQPVAVAPFVPSMFDIAPTDSSYIPTPRCLIADVDAAFENDLALGYKEFNYGSMSDISASTRGSARDSLVDMGDDEIIDIWKSTPATPSDGIAAESFEGALHSFARQVSYNTASSTNPTTNSNQIKQDMYQEQPRSIDATLSDLKYMRKVLLDQEVQLQSSFSKAEQLQQVQFAARSA